MCNMTRGCLRPVRWGRANPTEEDQIDKQGGKAEEKNEKEPEDAAVAVGFRVAVNPERREEVQHHERHEEYQTE